MFGEIILFTVLLPFGFGIILFAANTVFKNQSTLLVLISGLLVLGIYVLLEGMPSLPPVSSKHKVALILAGLGVVALVTGKLGRVYFALTAATLAAALVWLGWNRISDTSMLPRFLALAAPVALALYSSAKFDWQQERALVWPIVTLCFAIGGSILSLLGAYIGFAQALGALAAFNGGYILIAYMRMILRPASAPLSLPKAASHLILASTITLLFVVGLFAPDVSPPALAVLSLTLLVPLFVTRFDGSHRLLKPILIGLIAAVPTAASIAIAAL